mmetsp:Transcript_9893/g.21137  ORF Transcript_9893/g.21137 Transcript_9893/m.21137 type:complete len:88 (+) Transcript_9893:571-834(+)
MDALIQSCGAMETLREEKRHLLKEDLCDLFLEKTVGTKRIYRAFCNVADERESCSYSFDEKRRMLQSSNQLFNYQKIPAMALQNGWF